MPVDVSVVIPLYNKRDYVGRTIDSVLRQTKVPKEIIVVDDGSTDGGGDVARRLGGSRVRVLRRENGGVSAARNAGIRSASSRWIALLDADDTWDPGFLAAFAKAVETYRHAVAVFTNFRRDDSVKPRLRAKPGEPIRLLEDYFLFALSNRGFGMTSSSSVIRRDVLLRIGGFPEGLRRGEDIHTWSRVAWAGPVVFVPDILVTYWRTPGSVTGTAACGLQEPVDPWLNKMWPPDEDVPGSLVESGRRLFQYQLRWHAGLLIEADQKRKAREFLLERCSPSPFRMEYFFMLVHTWLP